MREESVQKGTHNGNGTSVRYVLFTVDVEDWFQVENLKACIPFSSWPTCELRVERNTHRLLDLLDSAGESGRQSPTATVTPLRATFFVLGWVAERLPQLVREIHSRGHEIASHGFHHKLCYECSTAELMSDLTDSRMLLEDIIGAGVRGYRAPSFSIDTKTISLIERCGYYYDSSFNSFGVHGRYGRLDLVQTSRKGLAHSMRYSFYELPISNLRFGRHIVPVGGGGYFRLIPNRLFTRIVRSILQREHAYLFYIHPWEVDGDQPKVKGLPTSMVLRHTVNLKKTMVKLEAFLRELKDCHFVTCSEYIELVNTE